MNLLNLFLRRLNKYIPTVVFSLFSVFVCGCGNNKQITPDPEQQKYFVKFDNTRYKYLGCRRALTPEEVYNLLGRVVDQVKLELLRQERFDFLEVIHTAKKEIILIEQEIAEIENSLREKSSSMGEFRRARQAEINFLWSKAVSATDRRLAQRANRFQLMLSSRMAQRGVKLEYADIPLEPSQAAERFEQESRAHGFWPEDQRWLEQQLQAWGVYEKVWREMRARIRRQVESLQTDSLRKLLDVEEEISLEEEKLVRLREKKGSLKAPLREAYEAVSRLDMEISWLVQDCVDDIVRVWCCNLCDAFAYSEGCLQFLSHDSEGEYLLLLFEDNASLLSFAVVEGYSLSTPFSEKFVIPRPVFEVLK